MVDASTRTPQRGWVADVVVATAIGGFLGLLGPFGSFLNGPAWQRIAYWVALAWLGLAVFGGGTRLILACLGSRPAGWAAVAVYALVMSAPFAVVSRRLANTLWPRLADLPELTPLVWYLEGLLITVPQVVLFVLIRRRRDRTPARTPSPPAGLLVAAPGEVLCLQMEDHYVRVHTAGGSRLVLATMAQAVAALGRTPGLRVHRSWWVAETAVADALAEGRNLRLALTNGLSAPVARSSVAAVRQAGWLRGPAAEQIAGRPERPLSQLR